MKNRNYLLFLLAAMFVVTPQSYSEVPNKFKVGIIAPLSGALSEYGASLRNGVDLAREASASKFDNLEVIFEDSRYDGKQSLSAFNKLRTIDKADLIFVWGSAPTDAVAPVAERAKYPILALGEYTTVVGKKHVINFGNPSFQFSEALLQYLRTQGVRKYSLILSPIAYLESLAKTLKESLTAKESFEIVDTYQPGETDFKTTVAKIAKRKPDAIGVYLLNGQISQFYRQMASQKINLPTFGTDFFESTTEIRDAGPSIEGAVFPHNVVTEDFRNQYIKKHGNDIQLPTASRGYDFANLVADQVKKLGPSVSGIELFQSLPKLSPHQGVSGTFKFIDTPETGMYFHFPIAVKMIKDGGVVNAE